MTSHREAHYRFLEELIAWRRPAGQAWLAAEEELREACATLGLRLHEAVDDENALEEAAALLLEKKPNVISRALRQVALHGRYAMPFPAASAFAKKAQKYGGLEKAAVERGDTDAAKYWKMMGAKAALLSAHRRFTRPQRVATLIGAPLGAALGLGAGVAGLGPLGAAAGTALGALYRYKRLAEPEDPGSAEHLGQRAKEFHIARKEYKGGEDKDKARSK